MLEQNWSCVFDFCENHPSPLYYKGNSVLNTYQLSLKNATWIFIVHIPNSCKSFPYTLNFIKPPRADACVELKILDKPFIDGCSEEK